MKNGQSPRRGASRHRRRIMPGGARTVPVRSAHEQGVGLDSLKASLVCEAAADGDRPRSGGGVRMRPPRRGARQQFFISLFAFVEIRKPPLFTEANKGNEESAGSQFP